MPELAAAPVLDAPTGEGLSSADPYPGLRPFREEDAAWFFGRSDEINELLKRLRRLHFVAVVGASGSGKSSLVRAGVLPQIRDGFLDSDWTVLTLRPGEQPLRNLARVLGEALHQDADDLLESLHRGPSGLVHLLRPGSPATDRRVLILVDQFEELFGFAQRAGDAGGEEVKEFLKLLLSAAASMEVSAYVFITMRLEWLGECAAYPGLADAINSGLYLVPEMTRRQLQQAILDPLENAGGTLSSALLDRMSNDLDGKADQLPVLQHVLMRIWQHNGARKPFDLDDYQGMGTFAHCLSNHAEEVFAQLTPAQQGLAERLFRAITQVNKNRRIRRPRPVADILAASGVSLATLVPVIEAFSRTGRSFLVTTPGPLTPQSILDISHEALIRQWDRLGAWVDNEAEIEARLHRLHEDAAEWKSSRSGAKACLYTSSRLLRAEELKPLLAPDSLPMAFLNESSKARFWALVRRRGWIAVSALLLIALALGFAYVSREHARNAARIAQAERQRAEAEALAASVQAQRANQERQNLVDKIAAAGNSATKLAQLAQEVKAKQVYVLYDAAASLVAKFQVQPVLQHNDFAIPALQQAPGNRAPTQSQVRFFHPEDRTSATRIVGLLRSVVPGGIVMEAAPNPKNVVPAGQLELWLAAPPASVETASAPPTTHAAPVNPAAPVLIAQPVEARPSPAPVLTASLSQDRVTEGHGVTLRWQSENATEVQIEGQGNVQLSGSLLMTPNASTSYKILAKGPGGSTSRSLNVEVAAPPTPVAAVPASAAPTAVASAEPALIKAALNRYKDAFESESLDDLKRVWPTIPKATQKNDAYVFSQFNAIRLTLACRDEDIHITGDVATATCQQTAAYTQRGTRLPVNASTANFRLRKSGTGWLLESVQ